MNEVFAWLDDWWYLAGPYVYTPDSAVTDQPWQWENRVYRAAVLPDSVNGIDIRPLKRLLRAVVAQWDPSPVNGPRLSPADLLGVSAEAWSVYQHLHDARNDEQASGHKGTDAERQYTSDAIPKGLICAELGIKDDELQKRIKQNPGLVHPSHGPRDRNVRFDVDALINTELYGDSSRAAAISQWKKTASKKR